ncbi:MAG: NADH-quinone oxidoreductase subunit H [Synergistetes bacterium]|nr:NADH-quinone oxidoreductase subunit H [Synergistota bacterium]MCX8127731.1 NADH-quinone oxidoreductase subunit H [Synergistota bacterium]MDW8191354.1 complex I subunit 1 family protein [Synergistota bacterium]
MLALKILLTIFLSIFVMFVGLLYKGIDRKIAARLQARFGPPIIQPFYDVIKLLQKENIVPENAVPWIFNGAPWLALLASISLFFYQPMGSLPPLLGDRGDIILIIYIFTVAAIAIVAGGFASGSPFATVGAQREMVLLMSYEFPLATAIIALAWYYSKTFPDLPSFSLYTYVLKPIWSNLGVLGVFGALLILIAILVVTPAELGKIPFDIAEAETEIAEGVMVEYSGKNYALFYIADGVKTIGMTALIVNLFFPWNLSSILGISGMGAYILDFLFFWIKVLVLLTFSVTLVRVAFARLKVDQIASLYWFPLLLTSMVGLLLMVCDKLV